MANSNNNTQYENLNTSNSVFLNGGGNNHKDSSSINSEDSNEQRQITEQQSLNLNNNNNNHLLLTTNSTVIIENQTNNGSITARSISSITGSLSFDLLDQLKLSNGSDIDSEGYSIRPDSSIG